MDIEKAKILIENTECDFSIDNGIFKGLKILNKYVDELNFDAAHNVVWLNDFESTTEKMSEQDVKQLAKYGFIEDEDSWAFFT